MDPLSITASIIAVLQVANTIISVCYQCKSVVKGSPWALTQTIAELQDLRHVLETLDRLAEENDGSPAPTKKRSLELLCEPESGPLTTCRRELQHLSRLIGVNAGDVSSSKGKAILRAIQ